MADKIRYEIGESVVNSDTFKTGRIIDATDLDDGSTEAVRVEYQDGIIEWVSADHVKKLLLETDPHPKTEYLNEEWDLF